MKLPVVSGREVIKALDRAGFAVIRQKGSHVKMRKVTGEKQSPSSFRSATL